MIITINNLSQFGCAFEAVMAAVLLLISLNSYSIYKITREKVYKWFSYSFFVIALAFFGRIAMELVIRTTVVRTRISTAVITALHHTSASDMLWQLGLFSYRSLMLIGLIGIFLIITKSKEKKNWVLLMYLAVLTAFASMQIPYIFDMTASVVLFLIFVRFFQNYLERPRKRALGVAVAFFTIFLSHVSFIFANFDYSLFVAGKFVQLLGYLGLLAVYMGIILRR